MKKIKAWAIVKHGKIDTQVPPHIPIGAKLYLIFPANNSYTKVTRWNQNWEGGSNKKKIAEIIPILITLPTKANKKLKAELKNKPTP